MSKKVKVGGVGKNPAIDKINQMENDNHSMIGLLKSAVFEGSIEGEEGSFQRQDKIIKEYNINFSGR